jgi:hypothetical protein
MSDDRSFMDKVLGRDGEPGSVDTHERTDEVPTQRTADAHLDSDERRGADRRDEQAEGAYPAAQTERGDRMSQDVASSPPTTEQHDAAQHAEHGRDLPWDTPQHQSQSQSQAGVDRTAGAGDQGGTEQGSRLSGDRDGTLIPRDRADEYLRRWESLKAGFVDEPRGAVRDANALVGTVLDELEELFTRQRGELESDLRDEQASTEDLRLALGRYRTFFDRLLRI